MSLVRPIFPLQSFLARSKRWFSVQTRSKPVCLAMTRAQTSGAEQEEKVVIVGGGIGGLATAVALLRLGIRSVVLEKAESLRTGGTSLTLSKNGWRVLDAISVGPQLRTQFLEIQGVVVKKEDGRELGSFKFKDDDQSQEVRAVERRVLLETLASQLPPQTIRFSSKLESIQSNVNGDTLLQLGDGTRLLAKIVIGCDGIRSKVATWMGFSEPKYVGYCAFRGLGFFPNGQPFQQKVNYIFGRGLRAGYVPVSATKVYWFICFNTPSLGPRITDPAILRKQAKELVSTWPEDLQNLIDLTPDEAISRDPLVDRWIWPGIAPSASKGRVVLVGDAWHPMTPNLGQGACCALEDSVVLANKLATAMNGGTESIEGAMESYRSERWSQVFRLTALANLVGKLLQSDNPLVCSIRDNIVSAMGQSSRTNSGTHKL
ncbi:FAD-binding domain [Arabidopsis thaliana x Arabidopsis arenosa]|uniref:FAD-binding domain n=1 Tax=Arabidopsis thaliana x Arabidopsis arenosa TaxID=1240361 RepID=A0A8T2A5U6_9BRAS|nr:FAD-binding domain [Arabidopsis thaliana x Arabidopsis arenosa]